MELGRWRSLMARLGLAEHRDIYDALCAAYAEPHRAYHTAAHIAACLAHLDDSADLARAAEEIEIALWFHDAVYKTRAQDNERRSADWANDFLRIAGAPSEQRDRVTRHIIATEHGAIPADPDSALTVDVDLAILGSAPEAYQDFEDAIRREYRWVPGPIFRRKRAEVLQDFLDRPRIYATDRFGGLYESPARRNLTAAIARLAG